MRPASFQGGEIAYATKGPRIAHAPLLIIVFDGQQLNFPHPMGFDRHGLDQTQRNATWLTDKLTSLNGCPIPVSAVLVLPGWWVERKGKSSISVLNAKELPGFFKGRAPTLPAERQRAIKAQLNERCRIDLS